MTTTETKPFDPKAIAKEIARRNKLFKGKTNPQKRVLIAKDVIDQIEAEKIRATSGTFCDVYFGGDPNDDESIQELVLKEDVHCNACALGALMMSTTLFNNKETVGDLQNHFEDLGGAIEDDVKFGNKFNEIFSKQQLRLIETAFERGGGAYDSYDFDESKKSEKQFNKAVDFGNSYENNEQCLIAIMRNIIKNKGLFVP